MFVHVGKPMSLSPTIQCPQWIANGLTLMTGLIVQPLVEPDSNQGEERLKSLPVDQMLFSAWEMLLKPGCARWLSVPQQPQPQPRPQPPPQQQRRRQQQQQVRPPQPLPPQPLKAQPQPQNHQPQPQKLPPHWHQAPLFLQPLPPRCQRCHRRQPAKM